MGRIDIKCSDEDGTVHRSITGQVVQQLNNGEPNGYNYRIDLQLFADPDKTEKATPRRRQKARKKKEQVPISAELLSGLGFIAVSVVFMYVGKSLLDSLVNGTQMVFQISDLDLNAFEDLIIYAYQSFSSTLIYLAFIIFAAALVSLAIGLLQTRFLFSSKPLVPDLNRLNPLTGLKRMFSLRSLFELAKAI